MSREETGATDSTETHGRLCSGAYVVQHHPDLNTYILSAVTEPSTAPHSPQVDVQELRRVILQNTTQVEVSHAIHSRVQRVSLIPHSFHFKLENKQKVLGFQNIKTFKILKM